MGIAFWLGLVWRRTTVAGAWAITVTGFTVWWLTGREWFIESVAQLPLAEPLNMLWHPAGKGLAIREPWVVVFYCGAALLAGIVVSRLTPPVEEERLTRFYDLTRTPIVDGEEEGPPCQLPPGVAPAQRAMLCTAWGLEIPVPSTTSILGFVAGWIAVAVLVLGFIWLVGA